MAGEIEAEPLDHEGGVERRVIDKGIGQINRPSLKIDAAEIIFHCNSITSGTSYLTSS